MEIRALQCLKKYSFHHESIIMAFLHLRSLSLPYISTEPFFHPFPRAQQLNAQHVIYIEEQVILLIKPGSWILQYFSGNFFHWKLGCQLIFCMCGMSGEHSEETSQLHGRVDAFCPKQGASNSQIQTTGIKRNSLSSLTSVGFGQNP